MLITFAGLPGSGKTTVSRLVADHLGATYLRVDGIESAIGAHLGPLRDSPVGYVVAERIAADQLRAGRTVVVDAVNAVEPARDGWRRLASDLNVPVRFVEVVCTDRGLHQQRVEARTSDLPGLVVPTWGDVTDLRWEPFAEPRVLVDNTGAAEDAVERVLRQIRTQAR